MCLYTSFILSTVDVWTTGVVWQAGSLQTSLGITLTVIIMTVPIGSAGDEHHIPEPLAFPFYWLSY